MNSSRSFKRHLTLAIAAISLPAVGRAQHDADEIIVTATMRDQSIEDIAQSVTVVAGDTLNRVRATNLGETLESQLGMSASYFGTGASRPIIRGLAGARVRTMEDGIESMDVSTVSDDHAASIDPLVARQVEIFRGPTTLLYGSGAAGGLVNVVTHPQVIGRPSRLALLRQFIQFVQRYPGVWFATGQEVAKAWIASGRVETQETIRIG